MKKLLLLSSILLCSSIAFGQTAPATAPAKTETKTTTVSKSDDALSAVERNVDRRLIYFNRYKKDGDMTSLSKLLSAENKDFYANFMKYVEASPVFTLKRDTTGKIVKTPTEEYVVPMIMTINGVEKKGSITFLEEKSETGTKWSIIDSNLHIKTPLSKSSNNLASNTFGNTPSTASKKPTTKTPTTPSQGTEKPITTVPVVSKPVTQPAKDTPTTPPPVVAPAQKGVNNMTIILIGLAAVLGIVGGVFGILRWRRKKHSKLAPLAAAAAVVAPTIVAGAAQSTEATTPMTTSPTSTTPSAPLESNVTVSTVENMQTPSTGDVLPRTQEIIEETPAITPTESQTTTPEGGSLQQTVPDNVAPGEKPTIFVPETVSHEEAPLFVSEPTIPETEKKVEEAVSVEEKSVSEELPNTPIIETEAVSPSSTSPVETAPVDSTEPQEVAEEKPLSPLFSAPEEVTEVTAPSTTTTPLRTNNGPSLSFEQPSETPPQDTTTQPHPLFENVLQNTEEAQPVNGLFDSLLTSKS